MVPSGYADGRRTDSHRTVRIDRCDMGSLGAGIHVRLPEPQRQWALEHPGRAGHHRGLCASLDIHLGIPHRGCLHLVAFLHRLLLGDGLHDAAERRLICIRTSLLVRSVKGLR